MRLFLLILFFSPLLHSEEAVSLKDLHPQYVLSKFTDQTSLAWLAAGAVSVMAVQNSDISIRNQWKDHQQMSESTAHAGDLLGSGIGGLVILGGQYLYDGKRENWKSHARALIYESSLVFVMKYAFGKQRPGGKSNYESFPSGHTATAFATATALSYSYGWKAAVIAYPLAAFVAASRLSDDMHWGSDVVGGAFLGTLVARAAYMDEKNQDETAAHGEFFPALSPENFAINYLYSF